MKTPVLLLLICSPYFSFCQDDLLDELIEEHKTVSTPKKINYTFKAIKLINANTIETTKKNTLDFRITHRFGNMKIGEQEGKHTLWGIENASNIRFSLDYGVTDKLSIGIGRSKMSEHIDWNLKYRFLEQKENGLPISVAYFANAAISAISNIPDNSFANRWSYTHQLIIASKITRGISLQILPTLIHQNYIYTQIINPNNGSTDKHDLFALGFAGRFKLTNRFAFVADYFIPFSDFRTTSNGYYDSLGFGIEIETGGHVFNINITNSEGIIENDYIPNTKSNWSNGEYKLGFNISRVFSF